VIVLEHDATGGLLTLRELSGTQNVQAKAAAEMPGGRLMVAGHYVGTFTAGTITLPATPPMLDYGYVVVFDGTTVTMAESLGGNDVLVEGADVLADGAIALCGSFEADLTQRGSVMATSNGASDIFVAVVEGDGTPRWARGVGGSGADLCAFASSAPDGGIFTAGLVVDGADFGDGVVRTGDGGDEGWIARHSSSGELVWARVLGGERVAAIDVAPDGRIVACGNFQGTMTLGAFELRAAGDLDAFAVGLSPDGEVSWARAIGGAGRDACSAVTFVGGGASVVVSGAFSGESSFGGSDFTANGPSDVFVHGFTP
jgi:hypothetical protein